LANNLCIAEKINKQGTWIFSLAIDHFGIQLFVVVKKTAIFRKVGRDTEMISFTRVFDSLYLFFDGNTITIQKPLLVAEAMLQDSSVKRIRTMKQLTTLSCVGSKSNSWANAHEWHGSCWFDETRNCSKWTSFSRHVPNTLAIILLCRVCG
jgi:hypothetical protein